MLMCKLTLLYHAFYFFIFLNLVLKKKKKKPEQERGGECEGASYSYPALNSHAITQTNTIYVSQRNTESTYAETLCL